MEAKKLINLKKRKTLQYKFHRTIIIIKKKLSFYKHQLFFIYRNILIQSISVVLII